MFLRKFIVPALLLGLCAFSASAANAGINGQQIRLDCPFMRNATVTIIGANQYGQVVQWQRSGAELTVTTTGWWWAGWVRVSYRNSGGLIRSQQVSIPRVQAYSDIFYVRCV